MADTDADDPDRRIVVSAGRDLDKQERYEAAKHVARDWDLWKLSLLGPVLWSILRILLVAGAVGYAIYSLRGYGADAVVFADGLRAVSAAELNRFARHNSLETLLALSLTSWLTYRVLRALRGLFGGIRAQFRTVGAQLRHLGVLFDLDTWLPQNYWHPFTSHSSDRDPLVVLANADLDAAVTGLYADVPYYKNVFVDRIYVRFDGLSPRRALGLAWFDVRARATRRAGAVLLIALLLVGRFDGVALTLALVALAAGAAALWFSTPALHAAAFGGTAAVVSVWLPVPLSATAVSGVPWATLELASFYGLGGYLAVAGLLGYVQFHRRFYGSSAGFSKFGTLTSDADEALFENDGIRLGNSLVGYGIFYVSEFLASAVGDGPYRIENSAAEDPAAADYGGEAATDPAADGHRGAAAQAGADLLESAVPRPADSDDGVTVDLAGVDFLREDWDPSTWDRLRPVGRPRKDTLGDGDTRVVDTVGSQSGVGLPVKRFMSVPWWDTADRNLEANGEMPFYFDESWRDEEVHYLVLGGAEHQTALVSLIRALKRSGYENVDLLENAFADDEDLKFGSEYFVSSVIRDHEDFRGDEDEDVFLYLRHRIAADPGRWVHVLYGMSALESKMGFCYWYDAFPDFADCAEDVLYRVSYTQDGIDDVGSLYTDPEWCRGDESGITCDWQGPTEWLVEPADDRIGCARVELHVSREKR